MGLENTLIHYEIEQKLTPIFLSQVTRHVWFNFLFPAGTYVRCSTASFFLEILEFLQDIYFSICLKLQNYYMKLLNNEDIVN